MDRPEEFRYALGYGTVTRVYQDTWEVDLVAGDGGVIHRVLVLGERLPEPSSDDRPQLVVWGFADHLHGRAVCFPIESRLTGSRLDRKDYLLYTEVQRFRVTIKASVDSPAQPAELEIRNEAGAGLLQLRLLEQDGVIRLDTPGVQFILKQADKSAELDTEGPVNVTAKADVTVNASGHNVTLVGSKIKLDGDVDITGALSAENGVTVTGDLTATGKVLDATGNTPHHSHS